jgi:hypothetical protein
LLQSAGKRSVVEAFESAFHNLISSDSDEAIMLMLPGAAIKAYH